MELQGLRVLVCESNKINLIRIYELLSSAGIQVSVTHTGINLIEKHFEIKPDLILINIDNPDFNTSKPSIVIRKNERSGKHTPIVILVEDAIDSLKHLKDELKIDGFLYNNFFIEDFFYLIENKFPHLAEKTILPLKEKNVPLQDFDKLSFIEYANHNYELMKKVLVLFMEEVPKLMLKLKLALINKYFNEIEYFAHSIKGMSGGVFAEKMKDNAFHIEIVGKSEDKTKLQEAEKYYDQLQKEFIIAKQLIEKFHKEL